VLGGRRVTGHWEKARPGQALETVLEERPCRVIIESEPLAGDGKAG
jgi:hypothetical protein